MSTKHHLSSAQELYVGAGYDARLFGTNARRGVPVHLLTRVSLGSPVVVWMHVQDTSTPEGLRGVAQYGG